MSVWTGGRRGDKVRLTHCGETGAYFGSRKTDVLLSIQCALYLKSLLTVRVLGESKRKGGGALSDLYPEPMHGFDRLACFFQSTRPEVEPLTSKF